MYSRANCGNIKPFCMSLSDTSSMAGKDVEGEEREKKREWE
jgi:hypothetical protein